MDRLTISKVANSLGVRTQRVYQFIKQGRLAVEIDETTGVKVVTIATLQEFRKKDRIIGNPGFKKSPIVGTLQQLTNPDQHWEPDPVDDKGVSQGLEW